jgi:hypothetical protein
MNTTELHSIKAGDRVTVSDDEFEVRERVSDPRHSLNGWYECIQQTGHAAVLGTIQYLSPSMILTGQRWTARVVN